MLNKEEDIKNWFTLMRLSHIQYDLIKDGDELLINVNGNINLMDRGLTELPVQFGVVNGNFNCSFNNLTTLKGCPKIVKKEFNCSNNELTSLKGCPEIVNESVIFSFNKIKELNHFPQNSKEVIGDFNCLTNLEGLKFENNMLNSLSISDNYLTSLKGCPQIINENINIAGNQITSLEDGPKEIHGYFNFSSNKLTNLDYFPQCKEHVNECNLSNNLLTNLIGLTLKSCKILNVQKNSLTTLKGCPESIKEELNCSYNQLETLDSLFNVDLKNLKKFNFSHNKIVSLQDINNIKFSELQEFNCSYNNINKLVLMPNLETIIFNCSNNNLTDIKNYPKKAIKLYFNSNKITSVKDMRIPDLHNYFFNTNNKNNKIHIDLSDNKLTKLDWNKHITKEPIKSLVGQIKNFGNFIGLINLSNNNLDIDSFKNFPLSYQIDLKNNIKINTPGLLSSKELIKNPKLYRNKKIIIIKNEYEDLLKIAKIKDNKIIQEENIEQVKIKKKKL